MTDDKNGRRKELAQWITSKDNPLTSRVIVNRVWQWHFGQALAGNPNNFGATGKKPTHPELLDWLAQKFMDEDWSFKKLHQIILSSSAYQRSTNHPNPESLTRIDPEGVSYSVFSPRRLSAEELRDSMLLFLVSLIHLLAEYLVILKLMMKWPCNLDTLWVQWVLPIRPTPFLLSVIDAHFMQRGLGLWQIQCWKLLISLDLILPVKRRECDHSPSGLYNA